MMFKFGSVNLPAGGMNVYTKMYETVIAKTDIIITMRDRSGRAHV